MNILKKLRITSVDLCRRGANQQAHIVLTKAQEDGKGGEKEVKSDLGHLLAKALEVELTPEAERELAVRSNEQHIGAIVCAVVTAVMTTIVPCGNH